MMVAFTIRPRHQLIFGVGGIEPRSLARRQEVLPVGLTGTQTPQSHLPKVKPCAYHGTCASRVLCVPLGLVEVRVSTERWPGHTRLKNIYIYI